MLPLVRTALPYRLCADSRGLAGGDRMPLNLQTQLYLQTQPVEISGGIHEEEVLVAPPRASVNSPP